MSDIITMADVTALGDLKLKQVATRVYNSFRLAAEKAVAHHAEPTKYPIAADPNSAEQIFLARFKQLQPVLQQAAVIKVMSSVKASQPQRIAMYGDLAQVNLGLATPVELQVRALPFPAALKFPISHLSNLNLHGDILPNVPIIPTIPGIPGGGLIPQATTTKLEFRIHQVKCWDETGSPGIFGNNSGGESGADEIALGGTAVEESGDVKKIARFKVGNFDEEDRPVVNYAPPKQFAWFNLLEGGTAATAWPKSYFVTLVLAEEDWGGFADVVNQLLNKAKVEVEKAIKEAVKEGATDVTGNPALATVIAEAVKAAAAWLLGKIIEWIRQWLGDDVFAPFTTSIRIPSLNARWAGGRTDSSEGVVKFVGYKGTYTLTYDWRLFT